MIRACVTALPTEELKNGRATGFIGATLEYRGRGVQRCGVCVCVCVRACVCRVCVPFNPVCRRLHA